jgi:hypothetical protein
LKSFILAVMLCGSAACATTAQTDTETPPDRSFVTGSNIPRKGQAVVVDKQAVIDQINRTNVPGSSASSK